MSRTYRERTAPQHMRDSADKRALFAKPRGNRVWIPIIILALLALYAVMQTRDQRFAEWANCPAQKDGDSDIVVMSYSASADMHTARGWHISCMRVLENRWRKLGDDLKPLIVAHRGAR